MASQSSSAGTTLNARCIAARVRRIPVVHGRFQQSACAIQQAEIYAPAVHPHPGQGPGLSQRLTERRLNLAPQTLKVPAAYAVRAHIRRAARGREPSQFAQRKPRAVERRDDAAPAFRPEINRQIILRCHSALAIFVSSRRSVKYGGSWCPPCTRRSASAVRRLTERPRRRRGPAGGPSAPRRLTH